MIDNYSIIGGGITGCVISLILSKKKKNISIYESSGSIGGVLKDLIYEEDVFFNGVQYLEANTNWLNLLKKKIKIYFISQVGLQKKVIQKITKIICYFIK